MRDKRVGHKDKPMHSKMQMPSSLPSAAIDIPTVAEVIAGMNTKTRAKALKAGEQHYWEAASN
jgi:hypothetical protein